MKLEADLVWAHPAHSQPERDVVATYQVQSWYRLKAAR